MAAAKEVVISGTSVQLRPGQYSRGGIASILVGPEEINFEVHGELLCKESLFFHGCLTGDFKEKVTGKIKLPEDKPVAFSIIVDWLYSAKLNTLYDPTKAASPRPITEALVDAYTLADKLLMESCKNEIMSSICDIYHDAEIRHETIQYIVQTQTCKSSRLRQFFAHQYAWDLATIGKYQFWPGHVAPSELTSLNDADFANTVIHKLVGFIAYMENKNKNFIEPCLNKCTYHDHTGAQQLCSDRRRSTPDESSDTDDEY